MELNSTLFSPDFRLVFAVIYGVALVAALRMARWRWITASPRLHLFLGATVLLTLLWHLRAQAEPVVALHLLGVTTLTLMFGWSLALLSTTLALIGLAINGRTEWEMLAINGVINGVVPISLSELSLLLVRTRLPKNFFIYVLVNGFLTAGLAALAACWLGFAILILGGVYSYAHLSETYLPFLPLLMLPEAFVNGWLITILVCYRPEWIYSFTDELYIQGK